MSLTLDRQLFHWFYGFLHQPFWLPFWRGITHLGDSKVVLVVAVAGAAEVVVARLKKRPFIPLIAPWMGVPAAAAITAFLKRWVGRPRPGEVEHLIGWVNTDSGAAFPSGHATAVFALATALSFRWPKWWPVWFGAAVLVALSRMALGLHWPSDLLAGALIGSGMVISFGWVESRISHIKEG